MSFFNALQQYVTNSVASLNISPRRFSVSRENEEAGSSPKVDPLPQPQPLTVTAGPPPLKMPVPVGNRSPSAVHRSSAHLLQERSKSLKAVSSSQPPSPRRAGGGRTASLKESSTLSITVPSGAGALSPSSSTAALTFAHPVPSSPSAFHSTTSSGKRREPKLLPTFALRQGSRRTSWPQFAITGSGYKHTQHFFIFLNLLLKKKKRTKKVSRASFRYYLFSYYWARPRPTPIVGRAKRIASLCETDSVRLCLLSSVK